MTAKIRVDFTGPGEHVYRWLDRVDGSGNPQPGAELHFRKVQPTGSKFAIPELLRKQAEVLVGDWESESTVPFSAKSEPGKPAMRTAARLSARWILDGAALEQRGTIGEIQYYGLIYWDPAAKQLRRFGVDSTGGINDTVITNELGKWVCRDTHVSADGTRRQCTFSPDIQNGGDKHVYDVSDITVNGASQSDYQDVWTRVRK